MDRRRFLQGASTLAGAAAVALPRSGWAKRSPNETINVAVVGINGRGKSHYAGYQELPNVRVSHVVEVDDNVVAAKLPIYQKKSGGSPKVLKDVRQALDDKDVDAISVATPDHWHSLMTIWGCQAGKDVYVEKPISHNISEGRKAVEAARKYQRVVAAGTQSRSSARIIRAMRYLHEGGLGRLYMAKALCYKPRNSIGTMPDQPVPAGLDYDLWLGPAPWRPYNPNHLPYKWHWFWDYGTTDMGNQGVHQMDIMRWGMNLNTLPSRIHGIGGIYESGQPTDQETPNTQHTTFQYHNSDVVLQFEVRGWFTNAEADVSIGNLFYGSEGWMSIGGRDIQVFKGRNNEPVQWDADQQMSSKTPGAPESSSNESHFGNFINSVRSRNWQALHADILEGHLSSSLCHLGNISYRVGRTVHFDSHAERFIDDPQADSYLTRNYRYPFVVPEHV